MAKEIKQTEKVEVEKSETQVEQVSRKKEPRERTDSAIYEINGNFLMRLKGYWAKLD